MGLCRLAICGFACGLPICGFALGLPIGDPHRLYVGYPYGFALGWPILSNMGFMRVTHIWVCIGFAHVCPTWVLCGLPIGFALGFPIWDPHWLYVGCPYVGLPILSEMDFMRATHMWVCIWFAQFVSNMWATYKLISTYLPKKFFVSKLLPAHTKNKNKNKKPLCIFNTCYRC